MKKYLLIFMALGFLGACEKLDKADKAMDSVGQMNTKFDGMLAEIKKTNSMAEKLKQAVPLMEMMKSEARGYIYPVPTRILPWAREFGAALNAKELAEFTKLSIKEINDVTAIGKSEEDANLDRYATLLTLQAIHGQVPQSTIDELIATQVRPQGEYERQAYVILMMRAQFIDEILLRSSLIDQGISNVGELEAAIEQAESIERIGQLNFANRISYKILAIKEDGVPYERKLNSRMILKAFGDIKMNVEQNLKLVQQNATGDAATDAADFENIKGRYNSAMQKLNSSIEHWTPKTP